MVKRKTVWNLHDQRPTKLIERLLYQMLASVDMIILNTN